MGNKICNQINLPQASSVISSYPANKIAEWVPQAPRVLNSYPINKIAEWVNEKNKDSTNVNIQRCAKSQTNIQIQIPISN